MIEPFNKVFDRHNFLEFAQKELGYVHQYNYSLSLLKITLNNLKHLEHHRYLQDIFMQSIGQTTRGMLRRHDCFAYLSLEEFVALLPSANTSGAIAVAQRLCRSIPELSFTVQQHPLKPTISVGIATYQESDRNIEVLLKRANEALLIAKSQGNNRFIVHPLDLEKWLTRQK
jgi:diguanylate cyclase (GGDEF)-like protein